MPMTLLFVFCFVSPVLGVCGRGKYSQTKRNTDGTFCYACQSGRFQSSPQHNLPICKTCSVGKYAFNGAAECSTFSARICSALGWTVSLSYTPAEASGIHRVCGASEISSSCSGYINYTEASDFCDAPGARICTRAELEQDAAKNTGCELNTKSVWTADKCKDGDASGFWTVAGAVREATLSPTTTPTPAPTNSPTNGTSTPTWSPTLAVATAPPTPYPTSKTMPPSKSPTPPPKTKYPTTFPTSAPTRSPTVNPTQVTIEPRCQSADTRALVRCCADAEIPEAFIDSESAGVPLLWKVVIGFGGIVVLLMAYWCIRNWWRHRRLEHEHFEDRVAERVADINRLRRLNQITSQRNLKRNKRQDVERIHQEWEKKDAWSSLRRISKGFVQAVTSSKSDQPEFRGRNVRKKKSFVRRMSGKIASHITPIKQNAIAPTVAPTVASPEAPTAAPIIAPVITTHTSATTAQSPPPQKRKKRKAQKHTCPRCQRSFFEFGEGHIRCPYCAQSFCARCLVDWHESKHEGVACKDIKPIRKQDAKVKKAESVQIATPSVKHVDMAEAFFDQMQHKREQRHDELEALAEMTSQRRSADGPPLVSNPTTVATSSSSLDNPITLRYNDTQDGVDEIVHEFDM